MKKTIIDTTKLVSLLKEGKSQKDCAVFFGVSEPAITKRIKKLKQTLPRPESFKKLTKKEQAFALSIAQGKTQTAAALESFDVTSRDSAKQIGSRLMRDPDLKMAVKDYLIQEGASPEWVAKRLKFWGDSPDSQASLRATENLAKMLEMYPSNNPQINLNNVHLEITKDQTIRMAEAVLRAEKLRGKVIDVSADGKEVG